MVQATNQLQPISLITLIRLSAFVSYFTTPEYNALFSGWKKLSEKSYSLIDSSIPLVHIELEQ
jgi:hypothetical protein